MTRLLAALLFFLPFAPSVQAQALPLREQARIVDEILAERLDTVLPAPMQREGIDLWIAK